MKAAALIAAAGVGTRMGTATPKPYLTLAGKPILAHTLAVFEALPEVQEITLVVHPRELEQCQERIIIPYGFRKVLRLVPGGKERQDSVYHGLKALMGVGGVDLVLVHDGVRPLVRPEDIRRVLRAARRYGAAVLGWPAQDTLKRVSAQGEVLETLDRRQIWQIQTPQAFRAELLWRAYVTAYERGFYATDEAALVEALPHPVRVLQGAPFNLKITTPADLVVAEALLVRAAEGS
ncbi:MAG: 2-C-methyl-D-erythritol 4-phosphate cytidylyltransferase [Syntrophobacterales bacterium]|nr:2-C-methyl-D-erythritol 4-phosphate cytidylyltransferase [Syntrophobacterales bacterium]